MCTNIKILNPKKNLKHKNCLKYDTSAVKKSTCLCKTN